MYRFECKDLGYEDGVVITGDTVDEVTRKAIDHAWRDHDVRAQSSREAEEFVEVVKSKIKQDR